jgi:hypothetical protein
MLRTAIAVVALFALFGCAEKPEPMANTPEGEQTQAPDTGTSAQGGGGEGVHVISPAAGGVSPVTNSDSVAGSGMGGVGNAAKDQAKRIGGGQSQGSLGNSQGDEDGG